MAPDGADAAGDRRPPMKQNMASFIRTAALSARLRMAGQDDELRIYTRGSRAMFRSEIRSGLVLDGVPSCGRRRKDGADAIAEQYVVQRDRTRRFDTTWLITGCRLRSSLPSRSLRPR